VNSAPDYVSILAKVRGSLPLSFDCHLPSPVAHGSTDEAEGSTRHVCLSIQRLLSEHDNTVTLPDTSGTVITSANLPNPLVSNDKFTLSADARRVDTIDSDGITLAAVQGAAHKQRRASSASDALRARIKELKAAFKRRKGNWRCRPRNCTVMLAVLAFFRAAWQARHLPSLQAPFDCLQKHYNKLQ
jgi:hypothetical protein